MENQLFQGEDVVVTYETMTNPLNIHNVNILVQKMIEKDEINDREKYWIEKLDAMNHSVGCNVAPGGDGGDLGEEVRKQISKTMKERGSQRGENNGAFGKHWFTNGVDTVFCEVCPDGYYPGTDDSVNSIRNDELLYN